MSLLTKEATSRSPTGISLRCEGRDLANIGDAAQLRARASQLTQRLASLIGKVGVRGIGTKEEAG
jgi:hypothetical protein